jgi:CheY-like chemotaxis protein
MALWTVSDRRSFDVLGKPVSARAATGVIVADNDMVIRGILRSILIGVGQDVHLAASGEEAVAIASRMQARLILLDLDMPKLSGPLACERLRAMAGYASTPIVILTAYDGEDARREAARAGATLFLVKPFQPTELLASLSPYLDIDTGMRQAMTRAALRTRQFAASDPEPPPQQPGFQNRQQSTCATSGKR